MMFEVHLLRVAELAKLTGVEIFELMTNARHIAGRYWMFEGEPEFLGVACEDLAVGSTEAHGDMGGREFIAHATDVFHHDFGDDPQGWEMVRAERWFSSRLAESKPGPDPAPPSDKAAQRGAAEVEWGTDVWQWVCSDGDWHYSAVATCPRCGCNRPEPPAGTRTALDAADLLDLHPDLAELGEGRGKLHRALRRVIQALSAADDEDLGHNPDGARPLLQAILDGRAAGGQWLREFAREVVLRA
ncbi:MAG: hypothetical protein GY719_26220 [bacterium]|nr:hypothetical protein [bacterium]